MDSEVEKSQVEEQYKRILKANGIQDEVEGVQVIVLNSVGDNFMSKCETATIQFQDKSKLPLELFSKRIVKNSSYAQIINEMQMYEREAIFYNEIVPLMSKFSEDKLGNPTKFLEGFPKCFHSDMDFVSMENLVKKGCIILDKTECHNFELARKVMKLFADLHAVTYALIREMGQHNFREKFRTLAVANLWCELSSDFMGGQIEGSIRCCRQNLAAYPVEGAQDLLDYLDTLGPNSHAKLSQVFDLDNESCATVLNHGDAWNCNLLFKKNPQTKEMEDAILIDFQTIHLGSPALDLQNYLYLSVEPGVRRKNWENLLKEYYEHFKENVHILNSQMEFTFEDLVKDFRRKCSSGFVYELFVIFGWDTLDDFGDLDSVEGTPGEHMINTMLTSSKRRAAEGENGALYSQKLVDAYRELQKVRLD